MSKLVEHFAKSVDNIKHSDQGFWQQNSEILEQIFFELHVWFDVFDQQKTDDYDYTGINCMKHREQRHHLEGIHQIVKILVAKYGQIFEVIIMQEAENHVLDDMGQIYFASDYKQIGFWKRVRGF
ncbi:hypothetical protein ACFL2U_02365 [Patescibacteria group bacterium]